MAPLVATKSTRDHGNNSKIDASENNSNNGSSSRNNSRCSSRSSQLRTSSAGEKSRASTPNQKKTGLSSKRTSSAKASKSPATPGIESTTRKTVNAHPLPSTMLHKHKQASVFASKKKKHKSNFSSAYDAGFIPCRINHGGIRSSLQWTRDPNTISFDPLLITCVEGFLETEHPFVFLSRTTFRELLKLEDARDKTLPILAQLIVPLRTALMTKDDDTFLMALEATRLLSDLVEGEMNVYLPKLTQQIHRKLLTKQLRTDVENTLAILESNGGKEALAIIRSKIPTYVSIR
ncbi:hypothetical protein PHMEG_00012975 [Phytophthora megakarya]|uniref:Uncharacterized protein n=1 Tax=Phytophthora megakarya TaxID=4795 RepID=A0A225W935_9STRA|nr:hypothetical protein PHMEG_00012975 [Phytophthora megakarya]